MRRGRERERELTDLNGTETENKRRKESSSSSSSRGEKLAILHLHERSSVCFVPTVMFTRRGRCTCIHLHNRASCKHANQKCREQSRIGRNVNLCKNVEKEEQREEDREKWSFGLSASYSRQTTR